jgi:hypothetical protein
MQKITRQTKYKNKYHIKANCRFQILSLFVKVFFLVLLTNIGKMISTKGTTIKVLIDAS